MARDAMTYDIQPDRLLQMQIEVQKLESEAEAYQSFRWHLARAAVALHWLDARDVNRLNDHWFELMRRREDVLSGNVERDA
jgi:hypothetical protein